MPEYLHPGVYVQEVPATVKPIEGASTSTAGFVGVADRGPVPGFKMPFGERPRAPLITSFEEYTRTFGSFRKDSYLTYALQAFFANGGKRAFIVRVVKDGPPLAAYSSATSGGPVALAAVGLLDREPAANATLGIVARAPGAWANALAVEVRDPSGDTSTLFKLVVFEAGLPVETYDDLSMDPDADSFAETAINSRSERIMVKANVPAGVTFAAARPKLTADSSLDLKGDNNVVSLKISAPISLGGPMTIKTERTGSQEQPSFTLKVLQQGVELQTVAGLSMDPTKGNFVERKMRNVTPRYVTVEAQLSSPPLTDFAGSRPGDKTDQVGVGNALPGGLGAATPGSDGALLTQGDQAYLGRADLGSGLYGLDGLDVNIIAVPGQGTDLIVSGGMAYCRNRPLQDAFFVADLGTLAPDQSRLPGAVPDIANKNKAQQAVKDLSTPNDYGAVYYPWIKASDPIGKGRNPTITLPPSGFLVGLYARIDNSRGVYKAPAGTETGLAGAIGLADDIQDADQDALNPIGLNCIRRFPGYGIVSWGTRTKANDRAWIYVPVRRTAIFLRTSIYRGIQWAVFEPNDEPLWSGLRLNIRSFMLTQFRAGAFQGAAPADAFFVKCDASTTTQQDIDAGVVNILVGFAPLKPAEFVVLKLSQKVNQAA